MGRGGVSFHTNDTLPFQTTNTHTSMNKLSFASLLTCAALTLAPFALNAADDAPPPPRREGRGGPGGGGGFGPGGGFGARGGQFTPPPRLTQEERTKLNEGLKKVAKDDGIAKARTEWLEAQKKAQEAQKQAQESRKKVDAATKAALLKADPELADIVKKFGDAPIRPSAGRQGFGGNREGGPRPEGGARPEGRRRAGNRAAPQQAPSADNI